MAIIDTEGMSEQDAHNLQQLAQAYLNKHPGSEYT